MNINKETLKAQLQGCLEKEAAAPAPEAMPKPAEVAKEKRTNKDLLKDLIYNGTGAIAEQKVMPEKQASTENPDPVSLGYLMGYMNKEAGPVSEYIAPLNPLNLIANPIGSVAAGFTKTRTPKEQMEAEKSGISNVLVPGKGAYNWMKRLGAINTELGKSTGTNPYLTTGLEVLGGVPARAGIQAGLGAAGVNPIVGAGAVIAPEALGAILAAITATRTKKEQENYEKSVGSKLMNLIPGVGTYNMFKRVGYAGNRYNPEKKK